MQPEVQMVDGNVGPVMPHLLLARSVYFFEVMKVLLDGGPIGDRFEDLLRRRLGIGAEERHPAIRLADQNHSDQAAYRFISGQEGPVRLGNLFAIEDPVAGLPTMAMSRTLSQTDRLGPILAFAAAFLRLAGTEPLGLAHIPHGGVLAHAT